MLKICARRFKMLLIVGFLSIICASFLLLTHRKIGQTLPSSQILRHASESDSGEKAFELTQKSEVVGMDKNLIAAVPVPAPPLKHTPKIQLALDELQTFASTHINRNLYNNPKTILIVTTWRSGSTFFGEALSSHPAVYYHYEPLTGLEELNTENELPDALYTIENLSRCDYSQLENYMVVVKNDTSILMHNKKLKRACQFLASECFNVDFLSSACNKFPIQVFKFVRIHAMALEPFLEIPDVHMIYLARDPRSIYASRENLPWCMKTPKCGDPQLLCTFLNTDAMNVTTLISQYPKQVHVIRYEDLATSPLNTLQNLFTKLEIDWDSEIETYIDEHTNGDVDKPWSTHRISKLRIHRWKSSLKTEIVDIIQGNCDGFMIEFKYTNIDTSLCEKHC